MGNTLTGALSIDTQLTELTHSVLEGKSIAELSARAWDKVNDIAEAVEIEGGDGSLRALLKRYAKSIASATVADPALVMRAATKREGVLVKGYQFSPNGLISAKCDNRRMCTSALFGFGCGANPVMVDVTEGRIISKQDWRAIGEPEKFFEVSPYNNNVGEHGKNPLLVLNNNGLGTLSNIVTLTLPISVLIAPELTLKSGADTSEPADVNAENVMRIMHEFAQNSGSHVAKKVEDAPFIYNKVYEWMRDIGGKGGVSEFRKRFPFLREIIFAHPKSNVASKVTLLQNTKTETDDGGARALAISDIISPDEILKVGPEFDFIKNDLEYNLINAMVLDLNGFEDAKAIALNSLKPDSIKAFRLRCSEGKAHPATRYFIMRFVNVTLAVLKDIRKDIRTETDIPDDEKADIIRKLSILSSQMSDIDKESLEKAESDTVEEETSKLRGQLFGKNEFTEEAPVEQLTADANASETEQLIVQLINTGNNKKVYRIICSEAARLGFNSPIRYIAAMRMSADVSNKALSIVANKGNN